MIRNSLKTTYAAVLLAPFVVLTGCATAPLIPGAEKVKVVDKRPQGQCKLIGPIWHSERSGISQSYQSEEHLRQDSINRLKNKAVKMGANQVVITKKEVTYTEHQVDIYALKGRAYFCKKG